MRVVTDAISKRSLRSKAAITDRNRDEVRVLIDNRASPLADDAITRDRDS